MPISPATAAAQLSQYGSGFAPTGFTPVNPSTAPTPNFPAAPSSPDISGLLGQETAINKRTKAQADTTSAGFDALAASTLASGSQAASNAGSAYANQELQQGVNPIASGVVAAQAKLPVYQSLEGIETQKTASVNDLYKNSMGLDYNIQNSIAGLREDYAKTLASYNSQIAGYNTNLATFNAGQTNQAGEFNASTAAQVSQNNSAQRLNYATAAAQLAASGGGTSSTKGGTASGVGYTSATPGNPSQPGTPGNPTGTIPDQGIGHNGYINPSEYVTYV
jgi:hypothetical protein